MPPGRSTAATTDALAFSATWEGSNALPTLAIGHYLKLDSTGQPTRDCADSELVRPKADGTAFDRPVALSPGYCALSMLFSDWDLLGPARPAHLQRPQLLRERRGPAVADRSGRKPPPLHRRRRLGLDADLRHGHRRHTTSTATAIPTTTSRARATTGSKRSPRDRISRATATSPSSVAWFPRGPAAADRICPRPPGTPSSRTSTTTASSTCSSPKATSTSSRASLQRIPAICSSGSRTATSSNRPRRPASSSTIAGVARPSPTSTWTVCWT